MYGEGPIVGQLLEGEACILGKMLTHSSRNRNF